MFFWEFFLDSSLLTPYLLHIQPYWIFLKFVFTYFVQLLCFYNICCISIFVRKIGMQYQIAADRNFYTSYCCKHVKNVYRIPAAFYM